jgi:excisionase family DNA binding protein
MDERQSAVSDTGSFCGRKLRSELLDVNQLAIFLNLKISKIRGMVFRNELPVVRIGRLVRFYAPDIQHWIEQRRSVSCGAPSESHGKKDSSIFEIDTPFNKA